MTQIEIPWPDSGLSPNVQSHWAVKAKLKKQWRLLSFALAKKYNPVFKDTNIYVSIEFYPPQNRAYDLDNLVARLKPVFDGIAEAWGINDKRFVPHPEPLLPKVKDGKIILKFFQK